eukprot:9496473-Pyramimonas_sp.AAC.1
MACPMLPASLPIEALLSLGPEGGWSGIRQATLGCLAASGAWGDERLRGVGLRVRSAPFMCGWGGLGTAGHRCWGIACTWAYRRDYLVPCSPLDGAKNHPDWPL